MAMESPNWSKAKKLLYDLELAEAAVKHTWHVGPPRMEVTGTKIPAIVFSHEDDGQKTWNIQLKSIKIH